MKDFRTLLFRVGVLLFVALLLGHCQSSSVIEPGGFDCSGEDDWRSATWRGIQARADDESGVPGCMQVSWGAATLARAEVREIRLKKGLLFSQGQDGAWDQALSIPLNAPKGSTLRFRVYFFTDESAVGACEDLKNPGYQCLSENSGCEAFMEFRPTIKGNAYQIVDVAGDSQKSCALEVRDADGPEPPDDAGDGAPPDVPVPDSSEPVGPDLPDPPTPPEFECSPGTKEPCTNGGSPCKGVKTCSNSGFWGRCLGAGTPKPEICGDSLDNNCDGVIDEDCPWMVNGGGPKGDAVYGAAWSSTGQLLLTGALSGRVGGMTVPFAGANARTNGLGKQAFYARMDPISGQATAFTAGPMKPTGPTFGHEGAAIAAIGDGALIVGYFNAPMPSGNGDLTPTAGPTGPSSDGLFAFVDASGNWKTIGQIGGSGPDILSDVACCHTGSDGTVRAYAVGLIRKLGTTATFTIGTSNNLATNQKFPVLTNQYPANSFLVLVELVVEPKPKGGGSAYVSHRHTFLAAWAEDPTNLNLSTTISTSLPRIAMHSVSGTEVLLYTTFAGTSSGVLFFGEKVSSSRSIVGRFGMLLRTKVSVSGGSSTYDVDRNFRFGAPDAKSRAVDINPRDIAVRKGMASGSVEIVVVGGFKGDLGLGRNTLISTRNGKGVPTTDVFVATLVDSPKELLAGSSLSLKGFGNEQASAVAFGGSELYITGRSKGFSPTNNGVIRQRSDNSAFSQFFVAGISSLAGTMTLSWLYGDGNTNDGVDAGHQILFKSGPGLYAMGAFGQSNFLGEKLPLSPVGNSDLFVGRNLHKFTYK